MKLQYLSTSPYSDATSRYKVVEFPETIGELFKELLNNPKEWATLYLVVSMHETVKMAECRYGEIIESPGFEEKYKNRKINSMFMENGWCRNDYYIT